MQPTFVIIGTLKREYILPASSPPLIDSPGGSLLYMTCSVFREENEQQLAFLQEEGLLLEDSGVLAGYRQAADTLFAGRLRQP